ncbi:unnamed protein product [Merluccius merluccius]
MVLVPDDSHRLWVVESGAEEGREDQYVNMNTIICTRETPAGGFSSWVVFVAVVNRYPALVPALDPAVVPALDPAVVPAVVPGVALEEAVVLLEVYLVVMVISFSWAVYFIFVSKPVLGKS